MGERNKQNRSNKMKQNIKKTSVFDVGSEKLEDMFTVAFKEAIDNSKGAVTMDELECVVEKDLTSKVVTAKMTVYGLAGTTSKPGFHDKKTGKVSKGFDKIKVGDFSFKFENSIDLNTNDYALVYVSK